MLLQTAIAWARSEPRIDWIDLGVFSDNHGAEALYSRHGFQVLGLTPDRFRVDGHSLHESWMTLNVLESAAVVTATELRLVEASAFRSRVSDAAARPARPIPDDLA